MIRVVIYQVETSELRTKIAQIDPKAFVSFTQAKTINGEGFEPFILPRKPRKPTKAALGMSHEAQYDEERMEEEAKPKPNATPKPPRRRKRPRSSGFLAPF
jgi:hypothetical protein